MFLLALPFAASLFSLILALLSLLPKRRSSARWYFFAGMVLLGADALISGLTLRMADGPEAVSALTLGLVIKSLASAAWLGFSLTYSRGDFRESLVRWRVPLAILSLSPIVIALGFRDQLLDVMVANGETETLQLRFAPPAYALNAILLLALVWILMNLEQTFRSAVGTMRWRIKFVVLGLAVIFGARLYVRSQALLYSVYDTAWAGVEASGLLIGCMFLVVAYLRAGFGEVDVHPSRAVLRSSLTVLIAGSYLFFVGILANLVKRFGGSGSFQVEAFLVLLGMAGLAVLLLSNRLRLHTHNFVARHFSRAQYDSVRMWTEFSRRLASVRDQADLCATSARLVSETFEVLSVTVWLLDSQNDRLTVAASTDPQSGASPAAASAAVAAGLRDRIVPFDLESINEPWAQQLRQLSPAAFLRGGNRWCVPLRTGEQSLGVFVLADRVNGTAYTSEQIQLLQCVADQTTSVLLNLRLANEVTRAREMEAFRTMSAFFVHDLKNAATSLNLMLKNLPVHFDDPAFRADALKGIGNTARRIDEMIGRLSALRQRPDFTPVEADLNQLVQEALGRVDQMHGVALTKELRPVPGVFADREQIRSVVINLVLNARDAVGPRGQIDIQTEHVGSNVVLSVTDNGCGMSEDFLKDSLFRPFQSTKKNGLGIGMFQSRMIVEAHGGSIRVESETGKGSTFQVNLPAANGR